MTKILDVGCGGGLELFYLDSLYQKTHNLYLVGVDYLPGNIQFADKRKKFRERPNLSFLVGDAEKLEFKNETFDIVICSEVLEHLISPERALREIKRVLKDRGLAIITTPNKGNLLPKFRKILNLLFLWKWGKIIDEAQALPRSDEILSFRYGGEHIAVKSCQEWMQICQKTGFRIEAVKRGSPIFGGFPYDQHPALFGFILIMDSVLDHFPFAKNVSEEVILKLRK